MQDTSIKVQQARQTPLAPYSFARFYAPFTQPDYFRVGFGRLPVLRYICTHYNRNPVVCLT